jgi:transposase
LPARAAADLICQGVSEKYETVKRRYYRFIERGVFDAMFAAVSDDADLEWLMIDSTTIRAHQEAAGARKLKGGLMPRIWADPAAA